MGNNGIPKLNCEELKAKSIQKKDFPFQSILQVIEVNTAKTKFNDPYLFLTLRDITDQIKCRRFTNSAKNEIFDDLYQKFDIGDVFLVTGQHKEPYGFGIDEEKKLGKNEFDINNLIAPPPVNVTELVEFLDKTIESIQDKWFKQLLEPLFQDEAFRVQFFESPSAIKYHHAHQYGNLTHVVGMLKILNHLETYYNQDTLIDIVLVKTCIILHDVGKLQEYGINNRVPVIHKDKASIGHPVLGDHFIVERIAQIDGFPKDLENRIRHLILSHHGMKRWGSPVEPKTHEARLLHYIDMVDSTFKMEFLFS